MPITFDVNENSTEATTSFTFTSIVVPTLSGSDAAFFEVFRPDAVNFPNEWSIRFIAAPDFENPSDAGADNIYDFSVDYDGGSGLVSELVDVTVNDVDDTAPTVVSMSLADPNLSVGETTTFTIEFSEAIDPATLDVSDFNVESGGIGALSTADNITFTATFTPTANLEDATNVIELTGVYADIAGNSGATGNQTPNYTVDTMAPTAPTVMLNDDTTDGAVGNNTDGITSDGLVDVLGLEPGATWMYSTDGGANFTAGIGASFTLPSSDADYDVVVRQTDAAGNTSVDSFPVTFTLDTSADADATTLSVAFADSNGLINYPLQEIQLF